MCKTVILILISLFIGNCTKDSDQKSLPEPDENVFLEGRVTNVDVTPMFVDGDGLIYVHSEKYGNITIWIPARERVCQARGLDIFDSVSTGDNLRLFGKITGPRDITVCSQEAHYIEKVE